MKSIISRLLQLTLIIALSGCSKQEADLIIISKDSRHRIEKWLSSINEEIDFREFYFISGDSLEFYLERADGIVIGGGEDVNPVLYEKPEYTLDCGTIDNYRDSIETVLILYALNNNIPLLGI